MGLVVPPSPPPVAAAVPAVNVAVATATRTTVAVVRPIMNVPFEVGPPSGTGVIRHLSARVSPPGRIAPPQGNPYLTS